MCGSSAAWSCSTPAVRCGTDRSRQWRGRSRRAPQVPVRLGSGAAAVTVTFVGKDRSITVPVVDSRLTVPTADLAAGDIVTLTDPNTRRTHTIAITAPKSK